MNEFEAHESSYDHQHKKRLKDMKEMQNQMTNSTRKEEKGPLMSIKLGGASGGKSGGRGFKKGGFKNAFALVEYGGKEVKREDDIDDADSGKKATGGRISEERGEDEDSDITDQEDYYDPRKPTGCMPGCRGVAAV